MAHVTENKNVSKKTRKTRNDTAVQGTNDSSIVSKLSATSRGYVHDDYLQYVVTKACRRAPLINRGYYIRARAVDHVFSTFLRHYSNGHQVVVVGAGFDTSFFRLSSLGLTQNTKYFEVDFPDVMLRKASLIQQKTQLSDQLSGIRNSENKQIVLDSDSYKMLGVDLKNLDLLTTTLAAAGFEPDKPTMFVSEVVLSYMTAESSSKVIEWAATQVENGIFMTYEQIYPDDAFGRIMMKHFDKIGCSLKAITEYPTPSTQVNRYQTLGWTYAEAMDMNYFYQHVLPVSEKRRIARLEPFDEYEEWHLLFGHYMILAAYRGDCSRLTHQLWPWNCNHHGNKQDVTGEFNESSSKEDSTHVGGKCLKEIKARNLCSGDNKNVTCVVSSREAQGEFVDTSVKLLSSDRLPVCRSDLLGGVTGQFTSCKRFGHTCNLITISHHKVPHAGTSENCNNTSGLSQSHLQPSHNAPEQSQDASEQYWSASDAPHNAYVFSQDASSQTSAEVSDVGKTLKSYQSAKSHDYVLLVGGFGEENGQHCRIKPLHVMSTTGEAVRVEYSGVSSGFDRMYHTTTLLSDDRLVIFGGRFSPTKPCDTSTVCVISPIEPRHTGGTTIHCQNIQTHSHTPSPRWRHSALAVMHQDREHVLVYGGCSVDQMTLDDLHILDTSTWTWSQVVPSGGHVGTHSHTADVWRGDVLLSGGQTEQEVPINTIYHINTSPDGDWWCNKLVLAGCLRSRYSHTSAVVQDKLLLVGGVSLHYPPPGVAVVDLLTHTVVEYQLQVISRPDCLVMTHGQSCAVPADREDQYLYIVGGGGNCFSFGTHLNDAPLVIDVTQLTARTPTFS